MTESTLVVCTLLSGAVLTDLARSKIYNFWILPAALVGVAIRYLSGGWPNLLSAIPGLSLPILFLFPFFRWKGLGAGDIKLLSVLSLFFPFLCFVHLVIASFLIGGIYAVLILIITRNPKHPIHFALPIGIAYLLYLGGLYS